MFSSMCCLERAFGIIAMFCCKAQRSKICAGVLLIFLDIVRTVGSETKRGLFEPPSEE